MDLKIKKQGNGMEIEHAGSSKLLEPRSFCPKISKYRSIGVFSTSENPGNDNTPCVAKTKWKPTRAQRTGYECSHLVMSKMFDLLSALKYAYISLQEAHIPYDPMKIATADEEMVSLLDSLITIKKVYMHRLSKEVGDTSASWSRSLAEIQSQERLLEKLKSRDKSKGREVARMRRKLNELEMGNTKLADEIKESERESFTNLPHLSFENVVKEAGRAIHDFAKALIALMKLSGWNLDRAANAVQESVVYLKRSHAKYAFEAYVARRMFHEFFPQPCFSNNVMNMDDTMEDPRSSFAEFCKTKYMLVVHAKMEECFFGNLDHRNLMVNGIHPNTQFYTTFVRMAMWVWYLTGFAALVEPKTEVFGVKPGSDFSDVVMEVVEELKEYKVGLDKNQERSKVEFMVMPGFKIGEIVIKSQVYVSRRGLLE